MLFVRRYPNQILIPMICIIATTVKILIFSLIAILTNREPNLSSGLIRTLKVRVGRLLLT
jgi:hypothetical protein